MQFNLRVAQAEVKGFRGIVAIHLSYGPKCIIESEPESDFSDAKLHAVGNMLAMPKKRKRVQPMVYVQACCGTGFYDRFLLRSVMGLGLGCLPCR